MNLNQVVKSFAGHKRDHGSERHSIKSLSKRLLTSRQTVRKMIQAGELPMMARFGTGNNRSYEFSSASLDTMRESIVEEIVREIVARLQGLDMTEQEMVLTALHGLRAHRQDLEVEFSKPNEDDDDESATQEVAKLIGGAGGAVAGASLGGRYAGLAGSVGGGILGGTVGSTAAGNRDLRRGALAGAGLYAVDKGIRDAGGYAAVGKSADALRGRIVDALRRAAAKAARAI